MRGESRGAAHIGMNAPNQTAIGELDILRLAVGPTPRIERASAALIAAVSTGGPRFARTEAPR